MSAKNDVEHKVTKALHDHSNVESVDVTVWKEKEWDENVRNRFKVG
jgi:hypothetical protein